MDWKKQEEQLLELARETRRGILPLIDLRSSGEIEGRGESGDVTYRIDSAAEEVLVRQTPERFPGCALYTEEAGLRTFGPWHGRTIVADPVDGSRPTIGGLEASCVSLALAEGGERATFADIASAALVEIRSGRAYAASRGHGARRLSAQGNAEPIALSANTDLTRLFWSFELCCRPVEPLADVYAELINGSSWKGGCFVWASCSFSVARLLGGQIDAYIDIWTRLARDFPALGDLSRRLFGKIDGLMPYDMAAAHRIALEAGCSLSDEHGRPLDGRALLHSREEDLFGCVAASNAALHEKLLHGLERRIRARSSILSGSTLNSKEAPSCDARSAAK